MRWVAAILFFVASAASTADARGPYGSIKIGNWNGGAYTNDDTGQFSGCIAGATYLSEIYFNILIDPQGNWRLGFSHKNWTLQTGQSFPIILTFDGQPPFNVAGLAVSNNLVAVEMPNDSQLITQFRKSKAMSAFAQGRLFQFNLTGTAQLLPALANCVNTVKQNGIAGAGDFTVASTPQPAKTTTTIGSSLKPVSTPAASPEMQIEAIELASNFILKSALRSPKVLSRAETPVDIATYGAAWRSEEASGFVRIIPALACTRFR